MVLWYHSGNLVPTLYYHGSEMILTVPTWCQDGINDKGTSRMKGSVLYQNGTSMVL